MNILFIIVITILTSLILILFNYLRKEKKKNEELKETIEKLSIRIKRRTESIEYYKKQYNTYKEKNNILTNYKNNISNSLGKNLRFVTSNGVVAHNVKIKTIKKGDNVIGITASIRRKVNDKWKDIILRPILVK